jgi:hypothetical protein
LVGNDHALLPADPGWQIFDGAVCPEPVEWTILDRDGRSTKVYPEGDADHGKTVWNRVLQVDRVGSV